MTVRVTSGTWRLAVVSLCAVMAGCSGRMAPTRPTATGSGPETLSNTSTEVASTDRADGFQPGFYPLRVGNRWDYLVTTTYRLVPDVGAPPPPEIYQSEATRQQVATEVYDHHQYVLEDLVWAGAAGPPEASARYRQDATGLYELDLIRGVRPNGTRAAGSMAATIGIGPGVRPTLDRSLASFLPSERTAYQRAARQLEERIATLGAAFGPALGARRSAVAELGIPGTAAPYELTRLRYPLQAKTRWVVRAGIGIDFVSEVVDAQTLELPPGVLSGYRIRVRSSWMGPNDSYEYWFGPSGFLQSVLRAELDAVDNTGNVIGRVTIDQREELQSLHLAGPSGPSLPPWLTPRPK